MSRLTPFKGLLLNLAGKIPSSSRRLYLPPEDAYRRLKELTGQDFGFDVQAWQTWLKDNRKR